MGSKKKKKRTPDTPLGTALVAEQDRGSILVGCAFLEHSLEQLLGYYLAAEARKRPQFGPGDIELIKKVLNPEDQMSLLGSGWAKSTIAYLLGLIDRFTYEGYDKIRKVRNDCAHRPGSIILDDSLISELMNIIEKYDNEEFKEINQEANRYLAGEQTAWSELGGHGRFTGARVKFMHACVLVDARITFKRMRYTNRPDITAYLLGMHHSQPNVVIAMQKVLEPPPHSSESGPSTENA